MLLSNIPVAYAIVVFVERESNGTAYPHLLPVPLLYVPSEIVFGSNAPLAAVVLFATSTTVPFLEKTNVVFLAFLFVPTLRSVIFKSVKFIFFALLVLSPMKLHVFIPSLCPDSAYTAILPSELCSCPIIPWSVILLVPTVVPKNPTFPLLLLVDPVKKSGPVLFAKYAIVLLFPSSSICVNSILPFFTYPWFANISLLSYPLLVLPIFTTPNPPALFVFIILSFCPLWISRLLAYPAL